MTDKIEFKVGQEVMIAAGYGRARTCEPGRIVKVGRVWLEAEPDGKSWARQKYRMDDQSDGTGNGLRAYFYTLDQWAQIQREREAEEFLREQGITVEYRSPWRGRTVELAELIRAHLATADTSTTPED